MVEINSWMDLFMHTLEDIFADRVWFVGLQGSYARGEATEQSDIDVVVILDELSAGDIKMYDAMLDTLSHRNLICGFLSGKKELLHWEPSDLFQFYYDTKPFRGSLDALLPKLNEDALSRAIKTGACNVYHGCVHNMLYDKNEDILKGLYKSASFIIQAICFMQTGKYVRRQEDLREILSAEEWVIVDIFGRLKQGQPVQFRQMSEALFVWSGKWIEGTK